MNTLTITQAITKIEAIADFKNGNVRSLANSLAPIMGASEAWEFSRDLKKNKPDFTKNDVKKAINPVKSSEKSVALTKEQEQIIAADFTKNDKMRKLQATGMGYTAIAKALGLTFQRVKNVLKPSKSAEA